MKRILSLIIFMLLICMSISGCGTMTNDTEGVENISQEAINPDSEKEKETLQNATDQIEMSEETSMVDDSYHGEDNNQISAENDKIKEEDNPDRDDVTQSTSVSEASNEDNPPSDYSVNSASEIIEQEDSILSPVSESLPESDTSAANSDPSEAEIPSNAQSEDNTEVTISERAPYEDVPGGDSSNDGITPEETQELAELLGSLSYIYTPCEGICNYIVSCNNQTYYINISCKCVRLGDYEAHLTDGQVALLIQYLS